MTSAPGPDPIKKIFHIKLCYAGLDRSDWQFNIFQPLRISIIRIGPGAYHK